MDHNRSEGCANKVIADELAISEETVKTHMKKRRGSNVTVRQER